jgi:hypothetical protein
MAHQSPEKFIGAFDSYRLRQWYRTELGQLPRALYLAKIELLNELPDVLDTQSMNKLARFVKRYWRFATQQTEKAPPVVKGMEVGILLAIPHISGPVFEAACAQIGI